MIKNWLIVINCLALLFVASCGKKIPNYTINRDLKAAFSYKPGTFWIFKDSISGEMDSLYVTEQKLYNFKSDNPEYTFDEIFVDLVQKHIGSTKKDSSLWHIAVYKDILYVDRTWYLTNVTNENFGPMPFPFVATSLNDENNKVKDIIGEYYTKANVFTNVVVCNSETTNSVYSSIIMNTSVGLIKINGRSYRDTTHVVLELLRWQLKK